MNILNLIGKEIKAFTILDNENNSDVIRTQQNDKYGVIDKNGNVIVNPVYDKIEIFHRGFAIVNKKNKFGVINESGEEVIPCIYKEIYASSGKYIVFNDDNVPKIIDPNIK